MSRSRGRRRERVTSEFRRQPIQPLRGWRKADGGMSPDKVPAEPAADHSIVIISNNIGAGHSSSNNNNSNSSNSSNGSSSGSSGGSSSRSPGPSSDRNNNIQHNNNSSSVTGAGSQSNAILHLTPHSVIQPPNQQSVIISTTAAGAVQVSPVTLTLIPPRLPPHRLTRLTFSPLSLAAAETCSGQQ